MGITLRSSIAAIVLAAGIQALSIGLISPNIPQSLCQPTMSKSFQQEYEAYSQLQLHNTNGAVKVLTHDLDKILVESEIRVFHQGAFDREAVQEYMDSLIQVDEQPNQLTILSEPEERPDNLDLEIHYILHVPRNTHLALVESDGNVFVGAGCGRVLVDGNNSDINIEAPLGPVEVQTANGRIRILDALDETIVETVNGNIFAQMQGGSLQATTANGSINAHILSTEVGDADLTAMNGGITMVVSDAFGAQVDASTTTGVVDVALGLNHDESIIKRREVRGSFGEGLSRLNLNSLNGNITIMRKST